jgi:hypothetical protein
VPPASDAWSGGKHAASMLLGAFAHLTAIASPEQYSVQVVGLDSRLLRRLVQGQAAHTVDVYMTYEEAAACLAAAADEPEAAHVPDADQEFEGGCLFCGASTVMCSRCDVSVCVSCELPVVRGCPGPREWRLV